MKKVEVLVISNAKIPKKIMLPITSKEDKFGVEYEGIFHVLDPKKVFIFSKRNLFCTLTYSPMIILSNEYNPDIIHSLTKEQFEGMLLEGKEK